MNTQFSIEWIYSKCMNQRHALGITLSKPIIDKAGNSHYEFTLLEIHLSEYDMANMLYKIANKIDTFTGVYTCTGYLNHIINDPIVILLNVSDVKEIECIQI